MATAWLKHSCFHTATLSPWVQSKPDVPRCAWLHVVIPSRIAWAKTPQSYSLLQEQQKPWQLRQTRVFLFSLNSVAFWKYSLGLFPMQLSPSRSQLLTMLFWEKWSTEICIRRRKCTPCVMCSKPRNSITCLSLHPRLIAGWGNPTAHLLNWIYKEFIEFEGQTTQQQSSKHVIVAPFVSPYMEIYM